MARTETVTVVFTDLVGSTELANRLGHDDYEALRQKHFSALRSAVDEHNGVEVKTTGDGLMLSFTSTADAVTCAIAMQQATEKQERQARGPAATAPLLDWHSPAGTGVPAHPPTEIRVGVSSGEATQEDNDLYGPPVVEAARLCAAAAAGQILVSDVVRLLARGKGHSFTSVGELTLKGLPEPVPAAEVGWTPVAADAPLSAAVPLPPRLAATERVAMVGRDAEQEVLARAWAQAKDGQRQVVLLSGEPGIGKTRLATETARAAHAEGAAVLLGTCDEDVHLPYQPFVELLRHYVTHAPDDVLAAHVREHKGELGRLVPELARRVPELPAPQVAEAETERYLLFDAVTGLLSAASLQQPLVLLLDDLQWAGTPELLLLKHILRSPLFAAQPSEAGATPSGRLLIIGTYRDSDLTRAHPLTAVLADLRREAGVQRVGLHGLDDEAVVALVAAAAGHRLAEPGLALAHALHRETGGSPFFIGEILRNLTESGAVYQDGDRWTYKGDVAALATPEGVKEVVGRRLARLAETTNKVLGLAAVIGRQFDVPLLTRVADVSEDAVLDALDEATAAALVAEVPGSADRFGFSHALTRTTLYEELSTARAARLHRRVGEALEELTRPAPGTRIDELAHHWLNAMQLADASKAIGYARQAGDHALADLAFEEAAALYERALGVLEAHDQEGQQLRCDLLLALANAQRGAGDVGYRETVAAAVEAARALGDGEHLARAVLASARPGGFMATASVIDEGVFALYEEASTALGEGDSLLRARLLGQLAVELVYTPQRERRDALSREAVAIARRVGDRTGLAQVLILRLIAMNDPCTLAARIELAAELAALAGEVGSSELAWHAAFHRAGALLESGDIDGAERGIAEVERLAGELRQPFYTWWGRSGWTMLGVMRGVPDAEAQVFATFEMGTAGGQPDATSAFGAQLSTLRNNQGRNAELTDVMRANVESQPHIPAWRAALARLYAETGQLAEAREQVDILRADGFDHPLNWAWCSYMVTLSEAVCELQDRSAAAVLYERLHPLAGQLYVLVGLIVCGGSYALYCGMLAACLGRWDDAERHFADALAMNERLGARPFVVRTRRAWAGMLLDRAAPGDAARARDLIAAGLAEAEPLGVAREVVRLQQLQARLD